ncbi:hypothetical protein AN958_04824 [Leucoagaricus sp. SymC.cos]|nr:hypothetical protein AN958_04824 [Leucoagaricus sp. SymC.cos]
MITLQPRAAPSALSRTTLIIIIVCAAVGGLVLLIILFRAIRSCRSRNTAPLPPIQPLAHHREHQLAQFEASLHPHTYDKSLLTAPRPPHSPQFGSSKTSLLGSTSSPHTSYTPTPTGEGSEELNLAPLEPESPLPGYPGFNLSTPPTSSLNINNSPTTSRTNTPPASSAPSSFARHSKSLPRLSRDDQARPHHHRPLSVASSLSRISSRRGLPHGLHSQVQIILPAPLAPRISRTSSHQSLHDYDIPGDRMTIVDRWVPAGRDSMAFCVLQSLCIVFV